ncbi:MAG TPA: hypothetical protein VK745_15945 [Polyangiaceae bacterium]|nr:hypothetical protein [Polyangiaceae bacterium]
MAYAALVSVKGDARSVAPSSSTRGLALLVSTCDRYGGLGFAAFVLLHLACQALRARTDGALPSPGLELQPLFVSAVLLVVWLPFLVFAWRELKRRPSTIEAPEAAERARALGILERTALVVVLLFSALHGAQIVWPLLRGTFAPDDVRPELIAALSSTEHGAPLLAVAYVCGVGAAAFFATRLTLRARPGARPLARVAVALGIFAYLLGSYAVIRCASGVMLP